MPKVLPLSTVVIVSLDPAPEERLGHLLQLLADRGVSVVFAPDADAAGAQLVRSEIGEVQCVLIDLDHDPEPDGAELVNEACLEQVRAVAADPDVEPLVVARSPAPDTILAAFRAGASDLIDLDDECDDHVLDVLHQAAVVHSQRVQRRKRVGNLRLILEDMMKNLIQTERRTIDLENLLASRDDEAWSGDDHVPNRPATVLVVDDDQETVAMLVEWLEEVGIDAHACGTGEEAAAYVRQMDEQGKAVDLVLVDIHMPGISGLDTIRVLRTIKPDLTAMLMTGYSDVETAVDAVDLGVVGYVTKPFDDIRDLVRRVEEFAIKSMKDARGRHYLEQIKLRHAKVLLRYRKLMADLEQLGI